jgi:hypothetical protein
VSVSRLATGAAGLRNSIRANAEYAHVSQSGFFYKQELPYIVTVTDKASRNQSQFLAYSPDEAPISFAPVTRTVFAHNKLSATFSDGVLTGFDEQVDGELVGLTALPADVISAYFTAVGSMFQGLKEKTSNQTDLVNAQANLAVAKVKQQACAAAIAANPLNGTDDANALAAIKAACT